MWTSCSFFRKGGDPEIRRWRIEDEMAKFGLEGLAQAMPFAKYTYEEVQHLICYVLERHGTKSTGG